MEKNLDLTEVFKLKNEFFFFDAFSLIYFCPNTTSITKQTPNMKA